MNAKTSVIWAKTTSGRAEMQARALVKQRAQRNLLLLIDGSKSQESLLGDLAGIGPDDFDTLRGLGLIAPVGGATPAPHDLAPLNRGVAPAINGATPVTNGVSPPTNGAAPAANGVSPAINGAASAADRESPAIDGAAPLDYARFTAELTRIIAKELGLRGFMLTLAVEKADSIDALRDVARRVLEQVRARKGEDAAALARHALYGH